MCIVVNKEEVQLFYAGIHSSGTLSKYDLNTKDNEDVLPFGYQESIQGMCIDSASKTMFVAALDYKEKKGFLYSSDLNGRNVQKLSTIPSLEGLTLDPYEKKLYWVDWSCWFTNKGVCTLCRCNFDGSEQEVIYAKPEYLNNVRQLSLDYVNKKLYWADLQTANKLFRINFDGSGLEVIDITTGSSPLGVAVNPIMRKIYWTSYYGRDGVSNTGLVCCADYDGQNVKVLIDEDVAKMPGKMHLDLVGQKLYFLNNNGANLYTAKLDGTKVQKLLKGEGDFFTLYCQAEIAY